jgi:spermidine synthase
MEPRPAQKLLIYLLFILSGFCALIYEVLWSKYLSLTFGTTIWAVSIVTATFMAGLALGSYLLGKYSTDHADRLLRTYAWLEVGIALSALLFAPTLALIEKLYIFWAHTLPDTAWLTTSVNIFFCALLLLPPATLMGGTFPVFCRLFARRKCGGQIGRLYTLNTIGATLGAFSAGYLLVPNLGLSTTGYLAVVLNLVVAGCAFFLSRTGCCSEPAEASPKNQPVWQLDRKAHRPVLIAIGLIGFFALAYEILWTRVLLLFLGNTVYAFSLMLSAYLVGIAIGGALYARLAHPELNEKKLFCLLTVLMAISILATAPFYDHLAQVFQFAHEVSGENWWLLSLLSFLIVFLVLGLPTILSGALLPAAVAILDPGKHHTGEGVGLVVLHNTVGAVFGSLVAGFVLIPWQGAQTSFTLLALCNLLLGLVLFLRLKLWQQHRFAIPVLLSAGLVLAVPVIDHRWDPVLLTSGVYCYAQKYAMLDGIHKVVGQDPVLALFEGPETTVGVHETRDRKVRYFTVNGKTDGGTGADMKTQQLIGHLPMLLHPDPQKVFVLGLGTGITLGAVNHHPAKEIDCAEISPEVVKASALFNDYSHKAVEDPRVNLQVSDGRNLLQISEKRYDVIISQPSNPWQTGNANLFTSGFYRTAADSLAPGGIFCQWIGLYDMTPENLRIASATFLKSFPHVLVFKESADLILVGAKFDLQIDYQLLQTRLQNPVLRRDLAEIGLTSIGDLIAKQYLFCDKCLTPFATDADLNTDDHPVLEYSVRHNLGMNTMGTYARQNMNNLLASMTREMLPIVGLGDTAEEVSRALLDLGMGYRRAGKEADARQFIKEAEKLLQPQGS